MKIWDISPPLSELTAVFPGDVPFERRISMDQKKGDHLQLSSFVSTFHLGAHADSSSHYHVNGQGVDVRPLNSYLGPCEVVSVSLRPGERITLDDLARPVKAPRVLFKTNSFPNPNNWNDDFMALSPELINALKQQGALLVGIDTPSVDPASSKKLESHQALFDCDMAVLEGLVLGHVPDDIYDLVALPLKFVGADASPVRAILLPAGTIKGD